MIDAPLILGTAGHIDHGKTALVQALTGIDTDRLKVEKERGITTELGFAHLDLGARRVGFIDVPGHERFIRAMVSGATGIDLVCLVVAADEGVMPQTREHLDICELLGARAGLVVLTKCDRVDEDWLELVAAEVREAVSASFLSGAAVIPCSARTGAGLDLVRAELSRLTRTVPARSAVGAFRLPVDRVFTIRGFGTVVTGTVASGRVEVRDELIVLPAGRPARARGLQVHGNDAASARAGMRCAVNVHGLAADEVRRGDVLAHPEALSPTHIIDARVVHLSSARRPLTTRQRVLLHHGTTQVHATVTLLEARELLPGDDGLAQIRIDRATPIAAVPGDRFLLRGFVPQEHYGTTLGGGEVLRVHAAKLRRGQSGAAELAALEGASAADRIVHEVGRAAHRGRTRAEIARRLGLAPGEVDTAIDALLRAERLVSVARDGGGAEAVLTPEALAAVEASALEVIRAQGELSLAELRARLPAALPAAAFDDALAALLRRRAAEVHGAVVRQPSRAPALSPLARDLAQRFEGWDVTPLRPAELPAEVDQPRSATDRAVAELERAGVLTRIKHDLYVHSGTVARLRSALIAHLDEHGAITPTQWKELTGASRKYSIPLAEHFDQEKITLRVGDVRKARGRT